MLHLDLPSLPELRALAAERADACVSIYLPTTPLTHEVGASRIAYRNLVKSALHELSEAGFDKRRLAALEEQLHDVADDDAFWAHQAHSLGVLATPDRARAYRLANRLTAIAEVADRFLLKPLLRAVTFSNAAVVLALSENGVRVIDVPAEGAPSLLKAEGMPKDAAHALGLPQLSERSETGRVLHDGERTRWRQYARQVDAGLRRALAGRHTTVILAAAEPLASVYRTVHHGDDLAPETIEGSPDRMSDAELASAARAVLDAAHAREIAAVHALFAERASQGRATTDIATAARAATFGAIEHLLVDMDTMVHGTVDDDTGAVVFANGPSPQTYGVVDEIACRALLTGARVRAVRATDLPAGANLAAVLRYPLG